MLRLLFANLAYRLRDWLRKPSKADVPRWTLRQIQEMHGTDGHDAYQIGTVPPRRPLW